MFLPDVVKKGEKVLVLKEEDIPDKSSSEEKTRVSSDRCCFIFCFYIG
jgi:hypothetical protein